MKHLRNFILFFESDDPLAFAIPVFVLSAIVIGLFFVFFFWFLSIPNG